MNGPFELGVVLPNYGEHSSPDAVATVATVAEELGFHSVWATEHFLVGNDTPARFRTTLDSLLTLSWLAAQTNRIRLGTSVLVSPLHHPISLAKRVATLQFMSHDRFVLGLGAGWNKEEMRSFNADFAGRGSRMDESLRLMFALWSGQQQFDGSYWSYRDSTFGPTPARPPDIWIGGASSRTVRRVREFGATWHPDIEDFSDIEGMLTAFPDVQVVPRMSMTELSSDQVTESEVSDAVARLGRLRAGGCRGVVLEFGLDPRAAQRGMTTFVSAVAPRAAIPVPGW